MHRRLFTSVMVSVLALSVGVNLHAAPFFRHTASDKAVSGKLVSFNVRNDSKSTLVLQSGEQKYSIEPGKTTQLKLAEGAEIVNVNGSEKQAAGSLLTKVNRQLQGNTLAVS